MRRLVALLLVLPHFGFADDSASLGSSVRKTAGSVSVALLARHYQQIARSKPPIPLTAVGTPRLIDADETLSLSRYVAPDDVSTIVHEAEAHQTQRQTAKLQAELDRARNEVAVLEKGARVSGSSRSLAIKLRNLQTVEDVAQNALARHLAEGNPGPLLEITKTAVGSQAFAKELYALKKSGYRVVSIVRSRRAPEPAKFAEFVAWVSTLASVGTLIYTAYETYVSADARASDRAERPRAVTLPAKFSARSPKWTGATPAL